MLFSLISSLHNPFSSVVISIILTISKDLDQGFIQPQKSGTHYFLVLTALFPIQVVPIMSTKKVPNGKGVVTCQRTVDGGVHTSWDRKLSFRMNKGLDLNFHILKKKFRGGHTGSPQLRGVNHPKHWEKKCSGSCDMNPKPMNSIQICHSNVHLTPHLTVSSWKWLENRFLITVLLRGAWLHRMR